MPCWHFCLLRRPPDYNYRWGTFELLSENNICMKTPAVTLKHRKWNVSLKVSSEKRATPLFLASVRCECQGLLFFFFVAFPTDLCNLKTKLLWWHFFALCSSFHACLKKRHIIIAAFYSKEQKKEEKEQLMTSVTFLQLRFFCLSVIQQAKQRLSLLTNLSYFAFFLWLMHSSSLCGVHRYTHRHKLCMCTLTLLHMCTIDCKAPI